MRITGVVQSFNAERGYGWIVPDDGGSQLFVHYSAIEVAGYKTLEAGERVEFDATPSDRGPRAEHVGFLDG